MKKEKTYSVVIKPQFLASAAEIYSPVQVDELIEFLSKNAELGKELKSEFIRTITFPKPTLSNHREVAHVIYVLVESELEVLLIDAKPLGFDPRDWINNPEDMEKAAKWATYLARIMEALEKAGINIG